MFKFRGLILFLSTILFFLCFGNGFSYSFPTITSISPENEVNIGSLEITVNGSDFQSGAQVKLTKGDDQITATSVLLVSSNEIKATFNLSGMSGGYWNVFVSNPDGQSVIFSESFGIIESALNFSTQLFWPSVDVTEIWGEEFIYVAPQWSEPVNKYNSEGVLVSSFKPVWPGADISISKSNKIYLASGHSSAILIHDLDGNQLKIHLLSQWAPGVVADSVDNMYVVGSYGVFQKFNSSGQLEWQINGSFPGGSFSRFRDIALNESEELLYIADYYNGILVFNNNGEYIKKFGEIGANYSEVCTEPSNDFILAYAYNLNQVHIFDQHGNLIMEFGRPEYFSGIITGFSCDGDGNVYTAFHEGLVQKFKLPPLRDTTPPSRVMDLHVIDKSSTSVTLGWTATGDDLTSGSPAYYDIRYSLSDAPYAPKEEFPFVIYNSTSVAGAQESFEIKNLEQDTVYYFILRAYDDSGNSSDWSFGDPGSHFTSTKTVDNVSPGSVSELSAMQSHLDGKINLLWEASGDNGIIGSAASYGIFYSTDIPSNENDFLLSAAEYPNNIAPKLSGSTEVFTLHGLSRGATYYIAFFAIDEEENRSSLSTIVSASAGMDSIPPQAVVDLDSALGNTFNEIDLMWSVPIDLGGSGIVDFELRYFRSPIETEEEFSNAIPSESEIVFSSTSIALTSVSGLNLAGTYYFAVKAIDGANNFSDISNIVSIVIPVAKDNTPPSTPIVRADSLESYLYDRLGASWIVNDPESGIEESYYSIGISSSLDFETNDLKEPVSSGIDVLLRGRSAILGNRLYDIYPHSEMYPDTSPTQLPSASLFYMLSADIDASSGKFHNLKKILGPQDKSQEWYSGYNCAGYLIKDFDVVSSSDTIYVTGGGIYGNETFCGASKLVHYAKPDKDGNISQWFSGTQLPIRAHSHDSIVYNGKLYVFIGRQAPPYFSPLYLRVFVTDIDPVTGAIGQWLELTMSSIKSSLPRPSVTVLNGKFFLIERERLYSAKINNAKGMLEPWEHQDVPFKTDWFHHLATPGRSNIVSFNNRLYVSGFDDQYEYMLYTAKPSLDGIIPDSGPDAWAVLGPVAEGGFLTANTRLYAGDTVSQFNTGGGDISSFLSSGKSKKVTHTGINPQPGQTLYFSVKSCNKQGLWSGVGMSDGILVKPDEQAPKITLTNPLNGHKIGGILGAETVVVNENVGRIYIGGQEITVLDAISENKITTIDVASKVLGVNKKLNKVYAITEYIPDGYSQKVTGLFVIDGADGSIITRKPLPGNPLLVTEPAIAVNEDTDLLYITNGNLIEVFDANTMNFTQSVNMEAADIYYSSHLKILYAVGSDFHLRGFDVSVGHNEIFSYMPAVSQEAVGLLIDDNNKRAYISTKNQGKLIVIDVGRKKIVSVIDAGTDNLGRSLLLRNDSKRVYAAGSEHGIYVFNTKDNSLIGRLDFGSASLGVRSLAFNSSKQNYYSCDPSSGTITVFEDKLQAFYKDIDSISVGFSITDVNSPLDSSAHLLKHEGLAVSTITVADKDSPSLEPGFYSFHVNASDPLGNEETLSSGIFEIVQDSISPAVNLSAPLSAYSSGISGNPSATVYDPTGDFVFVAKSGAPEIDVLDAKDGYKFYSRISVSNVTNKIILDDVGRKLYALHSNGVSVIDADTLNTIGHLSFGSSLAAIDDSPEKLFIAARNEMRVYVLSKTQTSPYIQIENSISTGNLPGQGSNPGLPENIFYDPSADRVLIGGNMFPAICALDYHSMQMICTDAGHGYGGIALDPMLNNVYLLSWARKKLFTDNAGTLALISELDFSDMGYFSYELAVNPQTHMIYAYDGKNMLMIDGVTNTLLRRINYPLSITNLFVGPDNKIMLAHQQENQITIFNETQNPLFLERFKMDISDDNDLLPSIVKGFLTDMESGAEIPLSDGGIVSSVPDDGFYDLQVEANDKAGNEIMLKTGPFRLSLEPTSFIPDTMPPRTELVFDGPHISSAVLIVSSHTIFDFTSQDDLSELGDNAGKGVVSTRYSIDFGALASGKFQAPAGGFHTISYFSIDREHNAETPKTEMIFVDDRAPISFITYPSPGEVLTGSFITITGVSYDFETETSYVEISTDNGKTYHYAVIVGTTSDGGVFWEYPFELPKDYYPIVLSVRSTDIVENTEEYPDIVPVFILNKLFPKFLAEINPRTGKPGEKVFLRVKVLDQFDRPIVGAPVNFSATTEILMPEGATAAGFSPSLMTTDEYGIAETTFTIPGKYISQNELEKLREEYENRAINMLKSEINRSGLPSAIGLYPPQSVYETDSMEQVVNQIAGWLANSGLVGSQSEFDTIISALQNRAQILLSREMEYLENWLPRLAEMRRGVVSLSANTFGDTKGLILEISTVSVNILSIPHPYDNTGLPTKDDGIAPNFMTLGNRSSVFTKNEVWGSVPGASELIAYSKARRQVNYANPSLHQQDFSVGKVLKSVNKVSTNLWKSFRTRPLDFTMSMGMNMAIMSVPFGGAFIAASDWGFRQMTGTGLEGLGLPMASQKFTFSLNDMVTAGILPSSFMPPLGPLNLGMDISVSNGVAKGGVFAGLNIDDSLAKNGLALSYHSLGGFSLGGYSGVLKFDAGQNDWYAGMDLLGLDAFKKIGSGAMSYGLNALNLTFAQGSWNGPVQFGIKDVEADWSAAKMMKSLDWGAQAPRFDIGKFGNLLNMESEWLTGLGERFKGVGPVFKDGSFDFNTPGFDSPKWNGSGSGLPGYSGGDNLLGDNDPSICSIYPAPGLPEEGVSSVQSGNSQRIGAFSLFKKSDGQAKTLYAAAGITKNPVNTVSGNLLYWVEDIALPGGQLFVQLMRVYNSLAPKNGPFGYGWSFNYGMSVEENSENATLLIGDGGKRLFFKNADGIFSSPVGTYSKLSKEADGSYTLTHIHGTRYLFSSGGKLSNIIDRNDNTIALAYSQECLSSMTDPSGRVVNFECDADKRITKITDFTGRALTYQYDNRGDMIKVTGTDGYNADYVYGSNHELLSYNDHTSRTGFDSGKFEYDEFNRVTTEFDSADNRIAAFSYTFSGDNMTTVITDAEGNITRDIYDEDGIWKSRKNPDGREVQLTFDSSANLLKIDDGISATEMTYDSLNRSKSLKVGAKTLASYDYDGDSGRVIKENLPDGSIIAYGYDAKGNITSITEPGTNPNRGAVNVEYDSHGNPERFTDPLGNATLVSYDANGNKISAQDSAGGIRRYAYAPSGKLASTIDENGKTTGFSWSSKGYLETISYPGNETYAFTYDESGKMVSETNEMGETTVYSNNLRGEPVSVTDAEGYVTELSYNLNGNLTQIKDPLGNISSFEYDAAGRMTKYSDPENGVFSIAYDGRGRDSVITDAEGNAISVDYDEFDKPVRITDPSGGQNIITYNLIGKISSITDPRGGEKNYSYDKRGLPVSIIDADGSVHSFEYDKAGNMTAMVMPDGAKLEYKYDSNNKLKAVTDFADQGNPIISFGLDSAGRATSITDATGKITSFELTWDGKPKTITASDGTYSSIAYDALGNPISIKDPNGKVTNFDYDAFSNLKKQIDAEGNSIAYNYNANGVPVKITYPDGSAYNMEYDGVGRVTKRTDPEGYSRSYRYDRNSNLILETDAKGNIWNYSHDANGRLKTVSAPTGQPVSYEYDGNGNITSINDTAGNTFSFEHDSANRLIKIDSPDLKTELFTRNASGRVTEFTDKAGRAHKFSYNRFGYLTAYTDALNRVTSYEYDKLQRPVFIKHPGLTLTYQYDALGRILKHSYGGLSTSFIYDFFGNLKETANPAGKKTFYNYDGLNRLTAITSPSGTQGYAYDKLSLLTGFTDTAGVERLYFYDKNGRLLSEKDPLGNETYFGYDADGLKTAVTDPAQNRSVYEYDILGRLIKSVSPTGESSTFEYDANSNMTALVDPSGLRTEYVYDNLNRLIQTKEPSGGITYFEYDDAGNQISVKNPFGDTARSYYDAADRLIKTQDVLGNITLYAYDANDNIASVTDSEGRITRYTYDGAGRLTVTTNPDGSMVRYILDNEGKTTGVIDELGRMTTYIYDNTGKIVGTKDALNRTISYSYNSAGRRISETDAAGHVTKYEYDAVGRLTAVVDALNNRTEKEYNSKGEIVKSIDALGRATVYNYDGSGRLISVTDANGGLMAYTYDAGGNKTKETYPDGRFISFEYDASGRLAAKTDAAGNRLIFAYDLAGKLLSETDPKSNKTLYGYDEIGRLITVTDANGGIWNYSYTPNGQLASIKDAKNNITSFSHDTRNRLVSISDPLMNTTRFEYDKAGRRTKMIKPIGESMEYTYDAGDRLTNIKSGYKQVYLTWSLDNMLTGVSGFGSYSWSYDAVHRLRSTNYDDLGKSLSFEYDAAGNKVKMIHHDRNQTKYTYDALNRLSGVTDLLNRNYTFTYDPSGRITSKQYPNGVTSSYTYNTAGGLEKLEHRKADGALLNKFSYAYDANNNRVSMTDNVGTRQYTYDKLNRLTKAIYPSERVQEFTYDPVGNRTKLTEEWPEILANINKFNGETAGGKVKQTNNYTYDTADNLLSVASPESPALNKTFTRDASGRLNSVTSPESPAPNTVTFDYDIFDRPWQITYPTSVNSQPSVYQYAPVMPDLRFAPSPLGLRVGKRDSGGYHKQMLDDRGNLLTEFDSGGYDKKRYVYAGMDEPLAMWERAKMYYYLTDGLGSVSMLTDKHGDPVQVYDYEAFGKPNVTAQDKNTIKYTSREYDPDAKLQYNRARFYDPDLGRFITKDPLAYSLNTNYYSASNLRKPLNLNSCSYGNCNPINNTDPTGLVVFLTHGFTAKGNISPDDWIGPYSIELGEFLGQKVIPYKWSGTLTSVSESEVKTMTKKIKLQINSGSIDASEPITLMGHSMGGIMMWKVAEKLATDCNTKIDHIVMMGTPFLILRDLTQLKYPNNVKTMHYLWSQEDFWANDPPSQFDSRFSSHHFENFDHSDWHGIPDEIKNNEEKNRTLGLLFWIKNKIGTKE